MAESSSSSSYPISTQNDVFLSFRGEDVRNNFVSHLQAALKRKGITTFFDEDKLNRGQEISPALLQAIQQSSISIVVFSQNYASSTWCLDELLKILQCRNEFRQIVMPVFYHVDPSVVRKQMGSYAQAFSKHEETLKNRKDEIQRWKDALTEVANFSGLDSTMWRLESEMIDKITEEILKKLNSLTFIDDDGLVGIQQRVERIESSLCVDHSNNDNDVRILGIWGMGGIGKTTVARTLFNKIKNQFDGHCFLENIRENSGKNGHGLPDLRKKLLSQLIQEEHHLPMDISRGFLKKRMCNMKVLIILDDIDHMQQLENLAGGHDWFGEGSRIVITTRNRQLLADADEVYDYATEQLIYEEALLLFSRHAFHTSQPPKVYLDLSKKAVNYACGIPLALKLLGSSLRKKDEKTWESALARLKNFPGNEIVKRVLELSLEGLHPSEKDILLDVACFFKGEDVKIATSVWQVCDFFPVYGLSVLEDKCLISLEIDNNSKFLRMHDLVQDMCKAIVCNESIEPGERSRLWKPKEIFHVFEKNTGTSKIQTIMLNLSETKRVIELREDAFTKMEKLRLLKFFSRELDESMKIRLPCGLRMLPDSLRYLFWDRYPNKYLPSKFDAQNLVGLSLRQSCINQLPMRHWMFKDSSICLKHLTRLDLSHSLNFSNLSAICENMKHLYELSLEGTGVSNVPSSIENLTRLVELKLSDCEKLVSLPDSICNLKCLKTLYLFGCKNLEHLPENIGNLESLTKLSADGTSIKHIPSSISCLKNISMLSFRRCRGIKPPTDSHCLSWLLPRISSNYTTTTSHCMGLQLPALGGFQKLQALFLNNCNLLEGLHDLDNLPFLCDLDLSGNNFETLPQTIFYNLSRLQRLNLSYCTRLRSLPELPPNLTYLQADECTSLESLEPLMSNLILYRRIGPLNFKAFSFGNCLKLKNQCNNMLESRVHLAQKGVQTSYTWGCCLDDVDYNLGVIFPGSEIPEWFGNQRVGNATTLHLPRPHYCLDKSLEFAVCFILSPKYVTSLQSCQIYFELRIKEDGKNTYTSYWRPMYGVGKHFSIKEDHVVFGFVSLCASHWPNSNHIESSIRFGMCFIGRNDDPVEVKKCAVRLVNVEEKTSTEPGESSVLQHRHQHAHSAVFEDIPDSDVKNELVQVARSETNKLLSSVPSWRWYDVYNGEFVTDKDDLSWIFNRLFNRFLIISDI